MIKFEELWKNHPTVLNSNDPCEINGKPQFSNQCAIRVGVALSKCGIDTSKMPGARHCWYHKKAQGHILAAEDLANSLNKYPINGIQPAITVDPKTFKNDLKNKKGIIMFKDYWKRVGEINPTGDHIDLWNGSRLTDPKSWARIHLRAGSFGLHSFIPGWSDLENSKSVIFWRIL